MHRKTNTVALLTVTRASARVNVSERRVVRSFVASPSLLFRVLRPRVILMCHVTPIRILMPLPLFSLLDSFSCRFFVVCGSDE